MLSKTSSKITNCQICNNSSLVNIIFLGYLPPVNKMPEVGSFPDEQPSYPALLQMCPNCKNVQLGLTVDKEILFPSEYPYTGGTTKILRDNFANLFKECIGLIDLGSEDLVVDIGSNDGTLLSNFANNHIVQGITPEKIGELARQKGIDTLTAYFGSDSVDFVKKRKGKAKIITATNVFAHIDDVHEVVNNILDLLLDDGVFISESHYLINLIEDLQYDTIYHEHLRYYSVHSLQSLFNMHGLDILHVKKIPSHGGSIRVYACRSGRYDINSSVSKILSSERQKFENDKILDNFEKRVVVSKLALHNLLHQIKKSNHRIVGIGAPSRASTLINYVGIDEGIIDTVFEIKGSHKIGKYIPGTLIPIDDERKMYRQQPEYALLLSWHIHEELAPKIKELGYKGDFIIPLPEPYILKNKDV